MGAAHANVRLPHVPLYGKASHNLSHVHFRILSASTISSLVSPLYLAAHKHKVLTDELQHVQCLFSAWRSHLQETELFDAQKSKCYKRLGSDKIPILVTGL